VCSACCWAHTNAPGSRHEKRWQDVEDLLNAGITVISTVNIQHFESLADLVENITGIQVRARVPDRVLDAPDEVELVDMSPHALRQRMKHGNTYPPERAWRALSQFFREGNLIALREMALRHGFGSRWSVGRQGVSRSFNLGGLVLPSLRERRTCLHSQTCFLMS
jgi:K+-sensing histidine kinase KdpD